MYKRILKPLADFALSGLLIIFLSPLLLILTIILSIANKGQPFFLQKRPGKDSKVFKIIKFKTMSDAKDKNGNLLPDAQRITKVGKFVRNSSMDELPQLFNVFKGDMSFVGPRPLLPQYLSFYNKEELRRHEVKPGITGWAQVNGRNAISWKSKFKFDVWYVDNVSWSLDIKIVWMTLLKVINREGISQKGQATMEEFKGTH